MSEGARFPLPTPIHVRVAYLTLQERAQRRATRPATPVAHPVAAGPVAAATER
jgi:hypothetical protein